MRFKLGLFFSVFLISFSIFAEPTVERTPASNGAPLDVLASQATQLLVPQSGTFKNRYILAAVGSKLSIIDTETWELATDQPTDFTDTISGMTLLANEKSVIVAFTDGNLARVNLDEIASENNEVADNLDGNDPRVIDLSSTLTSQSLKGIVFDDDSSNNTVYFINGDELEKYSVDDDTLTSITLPSTPNNLVFANGKIFMSATGGDIFVVTEGSSIVRTISVTITNSEDETSPSLGEIAVSPDEDFLYIIDTTNDVVWVLNTANETFVDQESASGTDPIRIESEENSSLNHVLITGVTNPTSTYGFVSGAEGLSLIDANNPTDAPLTPKVIDLDTSTTDVYDPLVLSGTPGELAASTKSDGYVYSSNGNANVSVITDNPFVTIDSETDITLGASASTFKITFQSDEAGSYRVVINSDITGDSGTELIADTVFTDADTDVQTATIDVSSFSSSVFNEGINRVFVFVTDADGNVGRDAIDITVDNPPPAVTITGTTFGNKTAYLIFDKLSQSDIKQYQVYAKAAASQLDPQCPGTLDFTSSPDGTKKINQSDCAESCKVGVSGLDNGIYYCLAVRAEDDGGQIGDLSFATDAVFTEQTVGPAELLGEAGCGLRPSFVVRESSFVLLKILLINFLILLFCRGRVTLLGRGRSIGPSLWGNLAPTYRLFFLLLFLFSSSLFAQEKNSDVPYFVKPSTTDVSPTTTATTKKNLQEGHKWFSFELKGAFWLPTNKVVKSFFGNCCNLMGEAEFGLLYKSQLNFTISTGYMGLDGQAVGISSGSESGDTFTLLTIPVRNNLIYRFDYLNEQLFVPYVGLGADYVYFHEHVSGGDTTEGLKIGAHGLVGLAILLDRIDEIGNTVRESGIDDVYATLEARYSKIDSFKSTGLDLSGYSFYFGVLFAF